MGVPIFWNRNGDFCPSIPVRSGEYHIYELHNILAPSLLQNVHVIDELVSAETTTDELKGELKDLKSHIMSSMTKVAPSVVAKWNKSQPPNRGPGLPQESTGQVPVPSAPPLS